MLTPTPFTVALDASDAVSALAYPARADASPEQTLVLAHGAGAPQTHPFMTAFARGLAGRGIDVVTFNFPYMERKRRIPDPAARLEASYRAVLHATRERLERRGHPPPRLVIGGKSMGGRIASQTVAADVRAGRDPGVAGLVFLGYPLHPPGRPDKLRAAHLPAIAAPMLFVQGSRDAFGRPDELRPVLAACAAAELVVVEGGDHSFTVRGREALSIEDVYTLMQDAIAGWIARIRGDAGARAEETGSR